MTDQPKPYPRGRPPKSKNVLLKSTMESISEDKPVEVPAPISAPVPEPIVEVKQKKPRTEKQQVTLQRMLELNKQRRKINIVDSDKEVKPEVKLEVKPVIKEIKEVKEVKPDVNNNLYEMMMKMEERLNQIGQKKKKVKVEKKEVKEEVKPKPTLKPQPKKLQREESSESESESDDEVYVEKYKQKAEKRFQAVKDIEQRLQQAHKPKGKYDHLSLF